MQHDRAMRAASKALIKTDLDLLKHDIQPGVFGTKVKNAASEKGARLLGDSAQFADDNRGMVTAGIAALIGVAGLFAYGIRHWSHDGNVEDAGNTSAPGD